MPLLGDATDDELGIAGVAGGDDIAGDAAWALGAGEADDIGLERRLGGRVGDRAGAELRRERAGNDDSSAGGGHLGQ
ncbi:unannotated protein [freshwater metagenome]|uniref:Unannotated protein n=1 Tax=freshwater metagenome TaxID=449393 RepID=A0A6J7LFW2_9ZZZZ